MSRDRYPQESSAATQAARLPRRVAPPNLWSLSQILETGLIQASGRVAASRPKALAMADAQTIAKLRLTLPPIEVAIRRASFCRGVAVSGLTIVEAVISMVIVAVLFVAALNTVGASRLTQHRAALISQGRLFASMLLSEARNQSYKDLGTSPVFGPEAEESTATRADFDDVDDYNGWSGPPTDANGTALANSNGWMQTVTVEWIDRLNPSQVQLSETGAKRITVTTTYNGVPQMTLAAIRTAGATED